MHGNGKDETMKSLEHVRTAAYAAIGTFIILVCLSAAASAQVNPMCGPKELVYAGLENRWKEVRVFSGLDVRGSIIEIFANRDTGTWTALMTNSAGLACQVGSGNDGTLPAPEPNI